jgi:ribulose-bisphosphate carboxylase large chain
MSRLHVLYRVHGTSVDDGHALATRIALEQSTETPPNAVLDRFVAEQVVGRVEDVQPRDDGSIDVRVGLAAITTGGDVAQTLNMLFGNTSLLPQVELVDVEFPETWLSGFTGPHFGVEGIREALGMDERRALTCAVIKPQGLSADRLGALCHTLACAGIDVIKDDHGLADQSYAPFAARVAACQRAVERARMETGHRAAYAPNLIGSPQTLVEHAAIARDAGAAMVLIAPAVVGMPSFAELVDEHLDVPVLAHPAYAGAVRAAPPFLLGKFFRLLGADAIIFPTSLGRFGWSAQTCAGVAVNAAAPWAHIKPALPAPGGGLSVENAQAMVEFYGSDVMPLIGGSILADPALAFERAQAMVQAVRAARPAPVAPAVV